MPLKVEKMDENPKVKDAVREEQLELIKMQKTLVAIQIEYYKLKMQKLNNE